MKKDSPKNVPASIRRRLQNRASELHVDFQYVLVNYAIERFLFRLAQSDYASLFVLKGALLFSIWTRQSYRPTRDIDLLAKKDLAMDTLKKIFSSIAKMHFPDDGIVFNAASLEVDQIRENQAYNGLRVGLSADLDGAIIPVQVDIGFGDVITPAPFEITFTTLLDLPAPVLMSYPRETVISEKFEAMVQLDMANSRMKDFSDLFFLSQNFDYDGQSLAQAIKATFMRRRTPLPTTTPLALTNEFLGNHEKKQQWLAFTRRQKLIVPELPTIGTALQNFLMPPTLAAGDNIAFKKHWLKGGSWLSN